MLFILAHLKPAMGIMYLKRCSGGIKQTWEHTQIHISLILKPPKHTPKDVEVLETHTAHTHSCTSRDFLTLVWQLANIGGDSHVQHVIDSRVNIVSSLDIMFTVGLVALLVAAVLQTVPLQVLECRCAIWGPGGRRGKCWLTVTSPSLTPSPQSLCLWWFVMSCPSFSPCPFLRPFRKFSTLSYVVYFHEFKAVP